MQLLDVPKLQNVDIAGKRVLTRVDFNVPLQEGKVTDDTRIRASLPTINYILEQGGRVALMSHLGRPKGKPDPQYSLEPVAVRLSELLDVGEVTLTDSCVGDGAKRVVLDLRDGEVVLLENLRFHAGETTDDEKFARELASLAEVYVNDAFGTVHRAHASVSQVARQMRSKAGGFLLEAEMRALEKLLGKVERPFVAILGGAKVSDKIGIIKSLIQKVDMLIIGGAMANNFSAALGGKLGRSLVESEKLAIARDLISKAKEKGVEMLMPTDVVAAVSPDSEEHSVVPISKVPDDLMALDIGPESLAKFKSALSRARTILWNGPMGLFEKPIFAEGTISMAKAIAGSAAYSVVGGGDSVAAVRKAGMERGFNHISTGGGAMLEMIEGKDLPGLEALAS